MTSDALHEALSVGAAVIVTVVAFSSERWTGLISPTLPMLAGLVLGWLDGRLGSHVLPSILLYAKRFAKGGAVKLAGAAGALVGGSLMVKVWGVIVAATIARFVRERLRAGRRLADEAPPSVWLRSSQLLLVSIVVAAVLDFVFR